MKPCACRLTRPFGVRLGLDQRRVRFSDRRARLGQIRRNRIGCDTRKRLTPFDGIAHVDQHFSQPQSGEFGPDDRLLPGDDVAVRGHGARPVGLLRNDSRDRQGGTTDRGSCPLFASG